MAQPKVKPGRKFIEVAQRSKVINRATVPEKSVGHGYPSTLHLWLERRPLATRTVTFAQMVDDPSAYVDTLLDDPATLRAAEREPFKREPSFGAASVNYSFAELTARAEAPA